MVLVFSEGVRHLGSVRERCAQWAPVPRTLVRVAFAKLILIIAIVVAALLGLYLRVRAWWRRRAAAEAALQREIERDLKNG